jgi:hypothetical protein
MSVAWGWYRDAKIQRPIVGTSPAILVKPRSCARFHLSPLKAKIAFGDNHGKSANLDPSQAIWSTPIDACVAANMTALGCYGIRRPFAPSIP